MEARPLRWGQIFPWILLKSEGGGRQLVCFQQDLRWGRGQGILSRLLQIACFCILCTSSNSSSSR